MQGERGGKKIPTEVIDAMCHCKQNGKYNLAFSLCRDNGANSVSKQRRLVIRQECFAAIESGGEGEGRGRSEGLRRRSYAVFSHSVICALGWLPKQEIIKHAAR